MMITVGSNSEARRYVFSGDERPLNDIKLLFEAGLGESGPESLAAKTDIYRALEPGLPADAVVATSTSGLLISELRSPS